MRENDKCFNTLEHGCIWGREVDWPEVNKVAQKDGFLGSELAYIGNILTYDTDRVYAFFRDAHNSNNYMVKIR